MGFFYRVRLRLALWLLSGLSDALPCRLVSGGRVLTLEQDFTREELFRQRLQAWLNETVCTVEKEKIRREALRLCGALD